MRGSTCEIIEKGRITKGPAATDSDYGMNGYFRLFGPDGRTLFQAVVSNQGGWEHVSISPFRAKRTPTWAEMCHFKDLFWREDETVIQYHPPKSSYINHHKYVLHLWRPTTQAVPSPPLIMV